MSELRMRHINRGNWEEWSDIILCEKRKAFPKMCWTRKNFAEMFNDGGYIARLGTINGEFAGFMFGIRENDWEDKEIGIPKGFYAPDTRVIHAYYLFLIPEFRAQGHGTVMLADFIAEARKAGYEKMTAIAKLGASLHNVHKFGMQDIKLKRNLYGSGETHMLCAMDL